MTRKTANPMYCKLGALLLACLLLTGSFAARAESAWPGTMTFTQKTVKEGLGNDRSWRHTYVTTALKSVNQEIKSLVDAMADRGRAQLPAKGNKDTKTILDVAPYISRTGGSYMSFLVMGGIFTGTKQTWVDMDSRVYNMETGERVTLDSLIADKEGWTILRQAVRTQLAALYPDEEADADALKALSTKKALSQAAFTLTAGHIALHFRADALYPNHGANLMHVAVYYKDLAGHLTPEAEQNTALNGHPLVAITFDDGPARTRTDKLIEVLRKYGADTTFFVVGERIATQQDMLQWEYNAGYSVGSHSWKHENTGLTRDKVTTWQQQFNRAMSSVIGTVPALMRAPGGAENDYIRAGWNLPMIHWSVSSGDANGNITDSLVYIISGRIGSAEDGDIVLCHDIKTRVADYVEPALQKLEQRGFLCVSVEDLYALHGEEIQNGTVYYGFHP